MIASRSFIVTVGAIGVLICLVARDSDLTPRAATRWVVAGAAYALLWQAASWLQRSVGVRPQFLLNTILRIAVAAIAYVAVLGLAMPVRRSDTPPETS